MEKSSGRSRMKREELFHLRSLVLDKMGYVLICAPDFPPADHTTLQREQDDLTSLMARHRTVLRTAEQLTWHRLAEQEVIGAFEAFSSGNRHSACSRIQQAEDHFRRSFKPKKIRPTFIAGPDGRATKF